MDRPTIIDEEHGFDRSQVPVLDGVEMSVVDDGPGSSDETLLFLHGNPSWSFLWRRLLGAAIEDSHRVIAPDHVGFGESEKPLSPAYHSLKRHIQNLESLVGSLGLEEVTLVMHDWGGPIGMGLATRQPDRIKRLVVTNTVAFAPSRSRSLSLWHKAFSSPIARPVNARLNLVVETAFRLGVQRSLDEQVMDAYRWPMTDEGARIAASQWVEMVPDGPEHETAKTLRGIQKRYSELQDVPVLVLWADSDPVMKPAYSRKWQEVFPDAEILHVSKSARHFWQEDAPDAFLGPMLTWIAKTG